MQSIKKIIYAIFLLVYVTPVASLAIETKSDKESVSYVAGRMGERKIYAFNYQGVELLPSRQMSQFLQVSDFYMRLRPNDLLRGFRLKDKDWAPGKDLGGAYSERPLSFGQWLAGFARIYRATSDDTVKDRAIYLMDEWGKTISQDGSYGYRQGEGGHYDYDKFVGGLVDMYEFTGSEQALVYLDKITSWAENNLDRSNEYALPTEWYTLSENLYRAYELTGKQRYYNFAKTWEYEEYWDAFARNEDVFLALDAAKRHKSYHAYSHVNSLSSAAMAYSATGKKHYLDSIINGYNFLKNTQLFATGGYGPEESYIVPNGLPEVLLGHRRGEANVDVRFHFETSCGSWAGFKLARYLMEFTGEAQYGDWIERLVYNGVGAMVPMNNYGMIMYGSSYNLYGAQKSHSTVWFCCQGSLPQAVADYHNLIYFKDVNSIYVNLYIPSIVDWESSSGNIRIIQKTLYPEDNVVRLQIDTNAPADFELKFRVPLWAKDGIGVAVNGQVQDIETKSGTWAKVRRKWINGDIVTLTFDIKPRAEPLPGYVSPLAVMCGPVVMVQATAPKLQELMPTTKSLRFPADYLEIGQQVRVNPARNLHTNQEMRPFYDLKSGEYYRMYFNRENYQKIPLSSIDFHGDWNAYQSGKQAKAIGSTFSAEFEGTAIVWEGRRLDNAGIATVTIDGQDYGDIDQFSTNNVHVGRMDQREVPFRWSVNNLLSGKHKIVVTVSGRMNKASKGSAINVSGLTAYK